MSAKKPSKKRKALPIVYRVRAESGSKKQRDGRKLLAALERRLASKVTQLKGFTFGTQRLDREVLIHRAREARFDKE